MKTNIFYLALVFLSVMLSVDAANRERKRVKPSRRSSSSASSASSVEMDEKVTLAEGIIIYRDLQRNDLESLRGLLSAKLLEAARDGDYKLIMSVREMVAQIDRDNEYVLIRPGTIHRCAVHAYTNGGDQATSFLNSLKAIQVGKDEKNGCFLVRECSNPGATIAHMHTIFYYEYRDGDLKLVKQKSMKVYKTSMDVGNIVLLLALMKFVEEQKNSNNGQQRSGGGQSLSDNGPRVSMCQRICQAAVEAENCAIL